MTHLPHCHLRACGDGDEVGVSFNRSSLSFEPATEISLSNGFSTSVSRHQPTITLVNVYVDLLVFTHIAATSQTGSGRYWC